MLAYQIVLDIVDAAWEALARKELGAFFDFCNLNFQKINAKLDVVSGHLQKSVQTPVECSCKTSRVATFTRESQTCQVETLSCEIQTTESQVHTFMPESASAVSESQESTCMLLNVNPTPVKPALCNGNTGMLPLLVRKSLDVANTSFDDFDGLPNIMNQQNPNYKDTLTYMYSSIQDSESAAGVNSFATGSNDATLSEIFQQLSESANSAQVNTASAVPEMSCNIESTNTSTLPELPLNVESTIFTTASTLPELPRNVESTSFTTASTLPELPHNVERTSASTLPESSAQMNLGSGDHGSAK